MDIIINLIVWVFVMISVGFLLGLAPSVPVLISHRRLLYNHDSGVKAYLANTIGQISFLFVVFGNRFLTSIWADCEPGLFLIGVLISVIMTNAMLSQHQERIIRQNELKELVLLFSLSWLHPIRIFDPTLIVYHSIAEAGKPMFFSLLFVGIGFFLGAYSIGYFFMYLRRLASDNIIYNMDKYKGPFQASIARQWLFNIRNYLYDNYNSVLAIIINSLCLYSIIHVSDGYYTIFFEGFGRLNPNGFSRHWQYRTLDATNFESNYSFVVEKNESSSIGVGVGVGEASTMKGSKLARTLKDPVTSSVYEWLSFGTGASYREVFGEPRLDDYNTGTLRMEIPEPRKDTNKTIPRWVNFDHEGKELYVKWKKGYKDRISFYEMLEWFKHFAAEDKPPREAIAKNSWDRSQIRRIYKGFNSYSITKYFTNVFKAFLLAGSPNYSYWERMQLEFLRQNWLDEQFMPNRALDPNPETRQNPNIRNSVIFEQSITMEAANPDILDVHKVDDIFQDTRPRWFTDSSQIPSPLANHAAQNQDRWSLNTPLIKRDYLRNYAQRWSIVEPRFLDDTEKVVDKSN